MNDTEDTIYIPIPHYPPFKLRSSLIDKDPVIWVHLLEAYIHLMTVLLDPETPKLNVKSQQQLQLFLKIFLFETCEEETKIFLWVPSTLILKEYQHFKSIRFPID